MMALYGRGAETAAFLGSLEVPHDFIAEADAANRVAAEGAIVFGDDDDCGGGGEGGGGDSDGGMECLFQRRRVLHARH